MHRIKIFFKAYHSSQYYEKAFFGSRKLDIVLRSLPLYFQSPLQRPSKIIVLLQGVYCFELISKASSLKNVS